MHEYERRILRCATLIALNKPRKMIIALLVEEFGVNEQAVSEWIVEVGHRFRESNTKPMAQLRAQAELLWTNVYLRAIEKDDNHLLAKATESLCRLWGVYEPRKESDDKLTDAQREERVLAAAELIRTKRLAAS